MLKPVEMCKLNVLVLNKHLTDTTRKLGSLGSLHLVDAVAQSQSHLLNTLDDEREKAQLHQLLDKTDLLIDKLGVDEDAEVPMTDDMAKEDIAALLNKIYLRFREQDKVMSKLLNNANEVAKNSDRLAGYPLQKISLDVLHSLSHFYMVTGYLAPSVIPAAMNIIGERGLIVAAEGKDGNILVLASRKNRYAVEEELTKLGFKAAAEPEGVSGSVLEERQALEDQLTELRSKLEKCRLAVVKLGEGYGGVLLAMRIQLRGLVAVQEARKHFGQLSQLSCISGWVPKEDVDGVRQIVAEATDGTGIVEVIAADEDALVKAGLETIPVKFHDSVWRRPFHLLISNFGMPKYNELDPTIFFGFSFVLLFGFMFGDVGQGAVLAATGLFLKFSKRPFGEMLRDVGMLLIACGLSAVLFGFCYGSVFGYEHLIHHLWLNPLKMTSEQGSLFSDVQRLLLTAVGIGIVMTSIAILFNIVNHFYAKHYYEGIFDKFGIIGLAFYWSALGIGLWFIIKHQFSSWQLILLAVPLVLLFIREPLYNILNKRSLFHGSNAFSGILEGIIDVMETLTGYLSGTVSFVRVGAFAISHAALCMAVFMIVDMLKRLPGSTVWQTVLIVLGNIGIIAFEGMVAAIQGVRLEYYELFGKYFSGGGVAYDPFTLKGKK